MYVLIMSWGFYDSLVAEKCVHVLRMARGYMIASQLKCVCVSRIALGLHDSLVAKKCVCMCVRVLRMARAYMIAS